MTGCVHWPVQQSGEECNGHIWAALPVVARRAMEAWSSAGGETLQLSVWAHAGELGRLFAWSARQRSRVEAVKWQVELSDSLDAFAFFEEDHALSLRHVAADWTLRHRLLPLDWLPGMLQVETDSSSPLSLHSAHAISAGLVNTRSTLLYQVQGAVFAVFENVHQGGFILTGNATALLLDEACLGSRPRTHWFYPVIETADSEPLFRCGRVKAVPLPLVVDRATGSLREPRPDDATFWMWDSSNRETVAEVWLRQWTVEHLPGNYLAAEGSERLCAHPLTAATLLQWAGHCLWSKE